MGDSITACSFDRITHGGLRRRSGPASALLLPECVDDYVDEKSPVRVVDALLDQPGPGQAGLRPRPPLLTPVAPATIQSRC